MITVHLTKSPRTRELNETLAEHDILHLTLGSIPQTIVTSWTWVRSSVIAIDNRCFTAGMTEAEVGAIHITHSPSSKLKEPIATFQA